jgi:hypothetical protein
MNLTLPSTLHKGNVERNEHRGDETENETRPNRPKIQRGTALAPEDDEVGLHPDQDAGQQTGRVFAKPNGPPHVPKAVRKPLQRPGNRQEQEGRSPRSYNAMLPLIMHK